MFQNECVHSIDNAVNDDIASYEELDGINIMTDTRHGWRKKFKDTSVLAIRRTNSQSYELCAHYQITG